MTPIQFARFVSKFRTGDRPESCWEWTGATNNRGYGNIRINKRYTSAHRVSYEAFVGPIPAGLFVLHRCDNPPCVRPDHLFLGTNAENMADMKAKYLGNVGSRHGMAKLTELDVRGIRDAAFAGEPGRAIARRYGVSTATVSLIVNNKQWRHVDAADAA